MSYCVIFHVVLLQFKCDVDTVGEYEGGIMVVYEPSIFGGLDMIYSYIVPFWSPVPLWYHFLFPSILFQKNLRAI